MKMMNSRAEQHSSRLLRLILEGVSIGGEIGLSDELIELRSSLSYFVPAILGEVYPDWNYLGLDDVRPFVLRRKEECEADLFGLCLFVADQRWTPIHLCLKVDEIHDEFSWLECKVGERGQGGMFGVSYDSLLELEKRFYSGSLRPDSIEWVYRVRYG